MTGYDVVTLGETMLRFTPPDLKRIEQTTTFDLEVGGSESNLAIGLARLGLKVLWLSRLTDNPLGRLIERTIARHGVDTSQVIWTKEDRVGLYFLEEGKTPRHSQVIYDRKNSAISQMRASELPVNLFLPNKARLLHLSGITPALSPNLAVATERALNLAKEAGWRVSFDLNYRHQLWSPAAAREGCEPFIQAADILLAPLRDVCMLYDLSPKSTPEQALSLLRDRYPQATIVLTLGKQGVIGGEVGGAIIHQPAFPTEVVDRLGGGDAFAAGFLYAYLTGEAATDRLAQALLWGAATAALKYTIPGDIPWISRAEVESLLKQGATESRIVR
ncbi:MAG: sugar kinase [Chloroflexi bacterium]|nr:sugar kinase [Chloroflexota bacterium]